MFECRPCGLGLCGDGAPTGLTGLQHVRGELAVAGACAEAGTLYIASTMGSYAIEEIREACDGPLWFQLYVFRDRGLVADLLGRAREARCEALVLTVDTPRLGSRERDRRNGFTLPSELGTPGLTAARSSR